ncbi:MAG: glycosyltransferase [Coxiellaceae bacterium]|nr:glycosyltransferase [Coxiellaceae bacterium]
MKVANIMLGRGRGGLENTFVAYCGVLSDLGYDVYAIVDPSAAVLPQLKIMQNIHITYFRQHGIWDLLSKFRMKLLLEKKIKPALVFVRGGRAMSFVKASRNCFPIIPVVANYNFKRLSKFKYVIAMTEDLKKSILNVTDISSENIFILRHPVSVPQGEKNINSGIITLGSLGRFVAKKGFDTFLRSIALLRDRGLVFRAILAGTGEEEASLKALSYELKLNEFVEFPGWLSPSEFFQQVDIFCLPSYHEPFGIVLVEALASHKTIVSTESEGPKEILTDQFDALLVPVQNSEKLANALELVLIDASLRKELAENAYKTYEEKYTLEKIKNGLQGIITSVLSC